MTMRLTPARLWDFTGQGISTMESSWAWALGPTGAMDTAGAAIALTVVAAEAIAAPAIVVAVAIAIAVAIAVVVVDMLVAHRMAAVANTAVAVVDTGNL